MLLEKNEVKIFVNYCRLRNILAVHVPNEFPLFGLKNKWAYINSLKAMGYSAGFPDLIVLAKNSVSQILFIEFKREKGSKTSDTQKEWQERLTELGYDCFIAKGSRQAIEYLEEYLKR